MCKTPKNELPENVIKGPWPDNGQIKISDVDGVAAVEELNWAENLTEGIMVQMIQTLNENNFDTTSSEFLGDIAFTIEVVKSVIYRNMGHEHPLHEIMESLVTLVEIEDGDKTRFNTELNFEALREVSDYISVDFNNDDGPELA